MELVRPLKTESFFLFINIFFESIFLPSIIPDDNFQYDDTSIPKCEDSTSGLCEGGILTIDGINGNTIWQTWTAFNVFSLYCSEDLNGDTFDDCVASGRGGVSYEKFLGFLYYCLINLISS